MQLIALILAVLYAAGFWLLKVPFWYLVAPLCGFFHIIPAVGVVLGVGIPLIVVLIAGPSWEQVAGILALFASANILETFVLTPVIHGQRLRLHPLVIFVSVIGAGIVFGPLGAFLAVPVLAVFQVIRQAVQDRRTGPPPAPPRPPA